MTMHMFVFCKLRVILSKRFDFWFISHTKTLLVTNIKKEETKNHNARCVGLPLSHRDARQNWPSLFQIWNFDEDTELRAITFRDPQIFIQIYKTEFAILLATC